jgi:hypothetical protein
MTDIEHPIIAALHGIANATAEYPRDLLEATRARFVAQIPKRMRRTVEIETSQFSDSPTKRWIGQEYLVEDATIEYPAELDALDDEELLEMADNEENGVCYIDTAPVAPWTADLLGCDDNHEWQAPSIKDQLDDAGFGHSGQF